MSESDDEYDEYSLGSVLGAAAPRKGSIFARKPSEKKVGLPKQREKLGRFTRWWLSLSIPRVRFYLHAASFTVYLLVVTVYIGGVPFGWMGTSPRHVTGVLRFTIYTDGSDGWDLSELIIEATFWVLTVSRWVEEAYQIGVSGSLRDYLSEVWNKLDMAAFCLNMVALVMRILTFVDGGRGTVVRPEMLDRLLRASLKHQSVAALFTALRFLEVLSGLSPHFGLVVIVMMDMMYAAIPVLLMMFVCVYGFGLTFTGYLPLSTAKPELFQRPWAIPLWAMLGEFDLQGVYDELGYDATVLPIILFLSAFFTTIFLVNLLIAQMTSSYEAINNNSRSHLLFQRLSLVRDYRDTRTAPPPINLIFGVTGTRGLAFFFLVSAGCASTLCALIYWHWQWLTSSNQFHGSQYLALWEITTWAIVLICCLPCLLWVTSAHRIRAILVSIVKCCSPRLASCLDWLLKTNFFCVAKHERIHSGRRGGFSVSASPSKSRAVERRERKSLQSCLQTRRQRDAETWQQQVREIHLSQQRLADAQRLANEQLNGRFDALRKRLETEFDDLGARIGHIESHYPRKQQPTLTSFADVALAAAPPSAAPSRAPSSTTVTATVVEPPPQPPQPQPPPPRRRQPKRRASTRCSRSDRRPRGGRKRGTGPARAPAPSAAAQCARRRPGRGDGESRRDVGQRKATESAAHGQSEDQGWNA